MTDSDNNNNKHNNHNNHKRLISLMAHSDDDDDDDDSDHLKHVSSSVKNQTRQQHKVQDNNLDNKKIMTTPIMKETKSKLNNATTTITLTTGKVIASSSSKKKQVSIIDSTIKKESIRASTIITTSTTNTTTTTPPQKWHQYRRDITDPIFMDTTASISAISYGARRLPEIKDLWMSCHNTNDSTTITPSSTTILYDNNNDNIFNNNIMTSTSLLKSYQSSGCKISSRHLRKRTTSYQNKQKRYHMKKMKRRTDNKNGDGCDTITRGVNSSRLVRRQNKNRLSKTLHENWRHVSENRHIDKEIYTAEQIEDTIINQKIMSIDNDQSHNIVKEIDDKMENNTTTCSSHNWMMTHMWHTKRFHMSKQSLWGWKIPMIHNNRGTQASIRLVSSSISSSLSSLKAATKWKQRNKKRTKIVKDSSSSIIGNDTNNSNNNNHEYDTTNEKNITDDMNNNDDDDDIDNDNDLIQYRNENNNKNALPKCLLYDATWCMQPIWFHINYNDDDNTTTDEEGDALLDLWIQMMTSYIQNFQRPPPIITSSASSLVTNQQSGEGMIHEKNAFPKNAIGPINWFYTNQPIMMSQSQHDKGNSNEKHNNNIAIEQDAEKGANIETHITNITKRNMKQQSNLYIYFWIHPSIHQEILLLWKNDWIAINHHYSNQNNATNSQCIHGPYSGVDGGITCLKLRGLHSTTKLCNILRSMNNTNIVHNTNNNKTKGSPNDQNNSDINSSKSDTITSNMERKIPMTESILLGGNLTRVDESFLSWTRSDSNERNTKNHIIGPQHLAIFMSLFDTISTNDDKQQQQQYPIRSIQCIRPRDPSLPHNYGVCGYDIFCHPDYVKEIFIKLIIQEGVCPIGYTDEASLGLECDPPILIFPRDYPDTKQGQLYWNNGQSNIWHTIRSYWEGGGGRIKDSSYKYQNNQPNILSVLLTPVVQEEGTPETTAITRSTDGAISSTPVVVQAPTTAIASDISVVVVRGMFGEPFEQALDNASPSSNSLQSVANTTKRRMRRPMSNSRSIVIAPPISKELIEYHNAYSNSLLKSLTLPAVLICHIQVIGKGRLKSLDQIHAPSSSSLTSSSLTSPVTCDVNSNDMIKDMIRLGFVTFGAFSMSRGRFHGIGIIHAASFLKALLLIPSSSSRPATTIANLSSDKLSSSSSSFIASSAAFRISNSLSSKKSIELRVFIHSNGIDHLHEAIIKLIL